MILIIILNHLLTKQIEHQYTAKRGPGMSKGLEWLNDVKTEVGCKVLTDVHETWQLKRSGL